MKKNRDSPIPSKVKQLEIETNIEDNLRNHEPALHEEIQQVNSRGFRLRNFQKEGTLVQGEL